MLCRIRVDSRVEYGGRSGQPLGHELVALLGVARDAAGRQIGLVIRSTARQRHDMIRC